MVQTVERWGAPLGKTFVNYPSIDAERFKRNSPYPLWNSHTPLKIVSTGRLNFQKGYPYALLALQKLHQQGIDFEYHIIGEGEARAEITYLIAALGLQDRVFLLGKRSSEAVKAILEEAHLYLLTSLYEGVANAALEAMALEIPVLSTAAGGMAEVIQSGENGLLVACCDVHEIAQSIVTLTENPNRLKVLGQNGRVTILNHHLIERQIDIFEQNYHASNQ
jgi:colanic acid/amylovoran biosynthesis glycosyltransferase